MLLPVLHLFNDGYLAAMPLILPFASAEFGLSMSQVGFLGSLLSFSGIVLAIPASFLSSRFGAVRVLSLAVLCYGIGFILLGASAGLLLVTLSFLLGSIAFGIFHPIAFSAVAGNGEREGLGERMGVFAATGDVGKIALASLLSFVIGFSSWRTASFLYGGAAILLFCISILLSRGGHGSASGAEERVHHGSAILRSRRFALANAASLLDSFANASLFIFIPFLLTFRGIDASFTGIFTSVFFVGNLLGKLAMGRMSDRVGKERLFILVEILIFISLVLLALMPSVYAISIMAFILGFLTKGTVPITSTMIAESVESSGYGAAYSVNSLSTSIANTAAPLFFGVIADILGVQAIFFACGIAALSSAVPALFLCRKRP